ncbi:MAG: hypothetical protein AAGI89_02165 [Pseudomonadota bacterium]
MSFRIVLSLTGAATLLAGCETAEGYLLATSSTVIGVKLEQSPTTQTPVGEFGYVRSEVAFVPTDHGKCVRKDDNTWDCPPGASAKNAPNVLMELRYNGIFSFDSSMYQRLAVGDIAVTQPGAAFMFAKGRGGQLEPQNATAVAEALGADQARIVMAQGQTLKACIGADDNTAFSATQAAKRDAIVDAAISDTDVQSLLKAQTTFANFEGFAQGVDAVDALAKAIEDNPALCN